MAGYIETETIPEAWQSLVIKIWKEGNFSEKYGKEMALLIKIKEPWKEPRMHPGDVNALMGMAAYRKEILEGTKDKLIGKGPSFPYTYHDRLTHYPLGDKAFLDQLKALTLSLKVDRERTNRNQAITWVPELDCGAKDPPCLQRIWCKIIDDKLVMHTTWRSRDAFRAWNMNVLALTELQLIMASELKVKVGSYLDFSNSIHLYVKTWEDVSRFIETVKKRRLYGYVENV